MHSLGRAFGIVFVLILVPLAARAAEADFASWLSSFRNEAAAAGITSDTLDKSLTGIEPIPRILELDQRQPESVLTFSEYVARLANPQRIELGRKKLMENRKVLEAVGRRYHVQPRFIVALWGIETDFGASPGNFPVIPALATLAYDGRRSALFRRELIAALRIVDQYQIEPASMTGSWAGAMGQTQFMPSTYLHFAVAFSGDGKPDIWHRPADVFASAANYLAELGWQGDQSWGRRVTLPKSFDASLAGIAQKKDLRSWNRLGLRRVEGGPLPSGKLEASLLLPEGADGPALLVYDNFRALLKWNASSAFATAVGSIADALR